MIVLDASAALAALEPGAPGESVQESMLRAGTIHAPELLLIECANVLRRRMLAGLITRSEAWDGMERLRAVGLMLHEHAPLLPVIFQVAEQITAYDATYVAVARALDAPLLTRDGRLARSAKAWCEVRLVA